MIVYHYTTDKAYNEIMRTGELRPSDPWTTMDATYGTGWYFTDLDPNTSDEVISKYCWYQTLPERVRYYLEFDIDSALLKNTRTHVYMLPINTIQEGVIRIRVSYVQGDREVIRYRGGGQKRET
jgi:hypothetical protein